MKGIAADKSFGALRLSWFGTVANLLAGTHTYNFIQRYTHKQRRYKFYWPFTLLNYGAKKNYTRLQSKWSKLACKAVAHYLYSSEARHLWSILILRLDARMSWGQVTDDLVATSSPVLVLLVKFSTESLNKQFVGFLRQRVIVSDKSLGCGVLDA